MIQTPHCLNFCLLKNKHQGKRAEAEHPGAISFCLSSPPKFCTVLDQLYCFRPRDSHWPRSLCVCAFSNHSLSTYCELTTIGTGATGVSKTDPTPALWVIVWKEKQKIKQVNKPIQYKKLWVQGTRKQTKQPLVLRKSWGAS